MKFMTRTRRRTERALRTIIRHVLLEHDVEGVEKLLKAARDADRLPGKTYIILWSANSHIKNGMMSSMQDLHPQEGVLDVPHTLGVLLAYHGFAVMQDMTLDDHENEALHQRFLKSARGKRILDHDWMQDADEPMLEPTSKYNEILAALEDLDLAE